MDNLIVYLFQSGVSLISLYILYYILLRKDTNFSFNRFFLLFAIAFSLIIPLLKIQMPSQYIHPEYFVLLETITISPEKIIPSLLNNYTLLQLLGLVYLSGVIFFLSRFIFRLIHMWWLIARSGIVIEKGLKVVYTNVSYAPFSFFNLIFINKQDKEKKLDEIYIHEKAHIKQKHTIDLLILEIASIILWFNPVIWLFKIELKNIHEFLADKAVISKGFNLLKYQTLLLEKNLGNHFILTNNFNHSLIKRRFIMMTKPNSSKYSLMKMVFIMPISILLVFIFSMTITKNVISQEDVKPVDTKIVIIEEPLQKADTDIFPVVEKMPEFPGGQKAMMNFLVENIKYPENARKEGISGRVFITYVVEKDGKISNIKLLRGFHPDCDKEALRVVSLMPDWKPGTEKGKPVRVQFNLPIKFNLASKAKKKDEKSASSDEGKENPPDSDTDKN